MVRHAIARGEAVPAKERQTLFIEAGEPEPLAWREIVKLRALPSFPVEI